MRVLILGSGAKDHAVAWWFSRSCYISALYIAPGNLATARFATNLPSVNPSDPADVYEACTSWDKDIRSAHKIAETGRRQIVLQSVHGKA